MSSKIDNELKSIKKNQERNNLSKNYNNIHINNKEIATKEMVELLEKKDATNIVSVVKTLLEQNPSFEEELTKVKVYQVSVAITTECGGIDMFDILSINQSLEKFLKKSKREIIDLKGNAYVVDPRGFINQFYKLDAYILRVQNIGEFQTLLQYSQSDLEKFSVYFGGAPITKAIPDSTLAGELLEAQKDVYYNRGGYMDYYPSFSEVELDIKEKCFYLDNTNISTQYKEKTSSEQGYLDDFPDASLLARANVKVLLQNIIRDIHKAILKNKSFIKTVNPKEIEFIFLNTRKFEEKGYEIMFDYDDHLDIDDDQLIAEDMHLAYISWEHRLQNKYS